MSVNRDFLAELGVDPRRLDCHAVHEILLEFLDQELDEETCQEVREHLRYCPPCAEEEAQEAALRQIMRTECLEKAPAALKTRIIEQIQIACVEKWNLS